MYNFLKCCGLVPKLGGAYENLIAIVVAVAKTLWDGLQSRPGPGVVFVWMLCPVDFY
jgi:hypothetical protein